MGRGVGGEEEQMKSKQKKYNPQTNPTNFQAFMSYWEMLLIQTGFFYTSRS